jgi:cobalamin biosynthetic protein CobC
VTAAPTDRLPHGGRLAAARAAFPDAPRPWIDLSTGINPVPYPIPDLPGVLLARLPEPEALAGLEAAAAAAFGCRDPALVAAAPGTQALIGLLPLLRPPAPVAILGPTYAEHAACWVAAGHAVATVPTPEALAEAEVAVLCSPNNPDGRRLQLSALVTLADRLAARGGWLVADEAFADLEPDSLSLAPAVPHPAIVVLRSFGKPYGLAGLRLGFALAPPPLMTRLRAALGPWPVSGPAIAIGTAALGDAQWRHAVAARLAQDAARLDAALEGAGLRVLGGTRLFRLAAHPSAPAIADALCRAGILVRRFADAPDRLRFGLPAPADWPRLNQALRCLAAT